MLMIQILLWIQNGHLTHRIIKFKPQKTAEQDISTSLNQIM